MKIDRLPSSIDPSDIVAIIDSREQTPLDLSPLRSEVGTLATGDYSLAGLTDIVAVERKSLSDLLGCIGRERERFERELQRLMGYPVRCLVIESSWPEIESGNWRGSITSKQVVGSLLSWTAKGIPVHLVGSHERAGQHVARLLYLVASHRLRESRELLGQVSKRKAS